MAQCAVIDVGIGFSEQLGRSRVVLKAVDVLLHIDCKDTQKVIKHWLGDDDVIINQMGVIAFKTKYFEQVFEFVWLQAWSHDTCHPEGIEVKAMNGKEYREAIALLKKSYSIRNVAKLTGKAVSTIQIIKKEFGLWTLT